VSTHGRKVAQELRALADDIATGDRLITGVRWYCSHGYVLDEEDREPGHGVPILPRAMHDALCPALAVLLEDEAEELLVCDRCKLAVENGAAR
jgi:hypothetical protein